MRPIVRRLGCAIAVIGAGLILLAYLLSHRPAGQVPGNATPAAAPVSATATGSCEEDEPCWDCHTMGNRQCGSEQHEVVVSVTGAPGTQFRVRGEVFGDTGPTNMPASGTDSAHFRTAKPAEQLDVVVYVAAPIGDTTVGCAIAYDGKEIASTERVPLEHTNTVACRVRRA